MAIVGQECVQVRKDTKCIRFVDVVKNAVYEDEIEALSGSTEYCVTSATTKARL